MAGLSVLILTTIGRKSGKIREVPLGYFKDEDDYVIIASNAGQPNHPAWYLNLQSQPQVNIQLKDKTIKVIAKTADPETRQRLWTKLVQLSPRYGNYQTQTDREIPVVILHPVA